MLPRYYNQSCDMYSLIFTEKVGKYEAKCIYLQEYGIISKQLVQNYTRVYNKISRNTQQKNRNQKFGAFCNKINLF